MKVIGLQSGSNGNCIYVETARVNLLIDAGITGRCAQSRLAEQSRDIHHVDALLISHDHQDHTRCMGVFQRQFGLPIHVTEPTLAAVRGWANVGRLNVIHYFASGSTLDFGDVRVETIPTPHDAADGVGFVIDDGHRRLGILTDLGHVFAELSAVIASLDAVVIESNYDLQMLSNGLYPESLKERIRGPHGHLSNDECAELLATAATPRLRWACLAHLSAENNRIDLALQTHRTRLGDKLPLHVASRYGATDVLEV